MHIYINLFKWLIMGKLCLPLNYSSSSGYTDKFGGLDSQKNGMVTKIGGYFLGGYITPLCTL